MRGNTTVVIDLPVDLEKLLERLMRVTRGMTNRQIWNAKFVDSGPRDGTPKQLSLTIGWDIKETE